MYAASILSKSWYLIATHCSRTDKSAVETPTTESELTRDVGTFFYVAPELLSNNSFGSYNEKVDVS